MLRTNTSALATEAANFERIAGELKSVIAKIESTGAEFDANWKGETADAVKQALKRFSEAATGKTQELNDIAAKIHSAATQYDTTDDERATALQAAMNLGR